MPAPPLRIGVQLPEVERDVGWPEYLAMARAAEESGFDSIWLGDHLLYAPRTAGPSAGRGRRGRCSPRSPRPRSASGSARSSPALASTRRP